MSEIVASIIAQSVPAAKEYGIRRVFFIISFLAFYLFAFVFWATLYFLFGKSVFTTSWPWVIIPAAVITVFSIIIMARAAIMSATFDQRSARELMKLQESIADEKERESVAISYLNVRCLPMLHVPKWWLGLVGWVFDILVSISIVVLSVNYGDWFGQIFSPITEVYPGFHISTSPWFWALLSFVLFTISFYYFEDLSKRSIGFFKANDVRTYFGFRASEEFGAYVSLSFRLALFFGLLAKVWEQMSSFKPSYVYFLPFHTCVDVPQMAERSFENIQGKKIKVVSYRRYIKDEKDIQALMIKIREYFKTVALGPVQSSNLVDFNAIKAVKVINDLDQTLYVGFTGKECVFIGKTYYSTIGKVRSAIFFFNNHYVSKEFKTIVEKTVDKAQGA